ncbi:MAG TPA: class I SAM-dependent methyltransferase [Dehalococcoidia bacterium]|jgi:ubiquinone/menaquinone biosynthesis C-methylase UbiE|nr:class I SAM-dependent methyltransferase [Dehalococcoidia bacterium]
MSEAEIKDESERSLRRVRKFYEISAEREWRRLEQPTDGELEFAVHKAWIGKFLPPPPARVLDIGGGPGRYSIWLAELGYRVTLADLSPDLLAIARQRAEELNVLLEHIGEADARKLSHFGDESFDAVVCLGPLYHLLSERDRASAAAELVRVLKPDGIAFAAFLNRLAVLRVAVDQDLPFFTSYTFELIRRWYDEGVFISAIAGIFTDTFSMHPADVPPFMESVGFRTLDLISSQSIAADRQKHLSLFKEKQPDLYPWVMERLIATANDPTTVGSGFHMLYIGQKP